MAEQIGVSSRAEADIFTLRKDISLRIAKIVDGWAETQRRIRQGTPAFTTYNLFLADLQALWAEVKYITKSANKNKTHKEYWNNVTIWFDSMAAGYVPEPYQANQILDRLFYILKYSGILDLTFRSTSSKDVWRENV